MKRGTLGFHTIIFLLCMGILSLSASGDPPLSSQKTALRPEVAELLSQAADAYRRLKTYQCKVIFQNESGFSDAMNMDAISGRLAGIKVEPEDKAKAAAIVKQIEETLNRASEEGDAVASEAQKLTPDPPSTNALRKRLVAKLRDLFKQLSNDAPSAVVFNWQDIDEAMKSLEPAIGTYTLALERPNKIALQSNSPELLTGSLFCDGIHETDADYRLKEYVQTQAPASLQALFHGEENLPTFNPTLLLFAGNLREDKNYRAMLLKAQVFPVDLGGNLGPGVALVAPMEDGMEGVVRVYFDARQHLVRKYRMDTPLFSLTESVEDIRLDEAIPAARFRFTPTKGLKKVAKFSAQPKSSLENSDPQKR